MRALLLLAVSSAALAQSNALVADPSGRGVILPPTSSAIVDDATALRINPGALSQVGALELFYAHEFRNSAVTGVSGNGDGLYYAAHFGPIAYGVSSEWTNGREVIDTQRVSWGVGFGGDTLSLGATFDHMSSDDLLAIDDRWLVDLGVLSRPVNWLSIGAVARNLNGLAGTPFQRSYEVGLAVRPLDERFTLGADYRFADATLTSGTMAYTLSAQVFRGFTLLAGASHGFRPVDPLAFHLGVRVDFEHLGVFTGAGFGPAGPSYTLGVRASLQRYPSIPLPGGKVALIDLADRLRQGGNTLGTLLGIADDDPYAGTIEFLDEAARDSELEGVLLKLDTLPDVRLAKVQELRDALLRLRASGKRVIAILLSVQDSEYLLATAADEIYALPASFLAVNGLALRSSFIGGTMEKLGVTWDVARVGAYKNAPDQLTRTGMSPEQREANNALLDTNQRVLEQTICDARKISVDQLHAAMANGLLSAKLAKELRLIDDVMTSDKLDEFVDKRFPGGRFEPRYNPGRLRDAAWTSRRRIAVIPVLGSIDNGKSRRSPLGDEAIAGAETVVRAIQTAEDDPRVAAIVLRVDSGGGGVLASDLMYRAALKAKAKKPVIASMGDVAASGGYYVSVAADEIWASPTTVTGSIGVFMVKPALEGLFTKLGISQELLSRGDRADIIGEAKPWSEEDRAAAQRWVDATYDDFISIVAERRKMEKAAVDAIARGRVWSGEDAKSRGLVDQFGGLWDAIASAKKRAKVPASERLDVKIYGEPRGFLAGPGGEPGVFDPLLALPIENGDPRLKGITRALAPASELLEMSGVQARMEYQVDIR